MRRVLPVVVLLAVICETAFAESPSPDRVIIGSTWEQLFHDASLNDPNPDTLRLRITSERLKLKAVASHLKSQYEAEHRKDKTSLNPELDSSVSVDFSSVLLEANLFDRYALTIEHPASQATESLLRNNSAQRENLIRAYGSEAVQQSWDNLNNAAEFWNLPKS